jgi:hypothetical protein
MAHFAELDYKNKVLRVAVGCNDDVANNGGDQSEQAAKHFETTVPLSSDGVKWVQTSYNNNFRGRFAGIDYTYDPEMDAFIPPQPYASWTLNEKYTWIPPIPYPNDGKAYDWNEIDQTWEQGKLMSL